MRRSCEAVMSRKVSSSAPSRVVALRDLDRIAGVAQADEVDALDDAAVFDVETGNDASGEHGLWLTVLASRHAIASRKRTAPV